MNQPSIILINCPLHVVPILKQEVEALGYTVTWEHPNGVEIRGTISDCVRLNYYLRTASKVLWMVKKFKAGNADELFNGISEIQWENYLLIEKPFSVTSFTNNKTINNTLYTNLKTKDAIVDRFRRKKGNRPDSGSERSGAVVFIHWDNHTVSVYLNTSGESLSRHGYRKNPFLAPLQENLSAALILSTGWDSNSSFVNPMCGSGTFAIEAALIALGRYPGYIRTDYGFQHLKDYDEEFYRDISYEAELKSKTKINFKIIASDISSEAIRVAKKNAEAARVSEFIDFICCPVEETPVPEEKGIVMMNPPYGERMGEEESMIPLYKMIGDFMKQKCAGYKGYVFTGNFEAAKFIGLKPKSRKLFYNAKIECKLFGFDLYAGKKYSADIKNIN